MSPSSLKSELATASVVPPGVPEPVLTAWRTDLDEQLDGGRSMRGPCDQGLEGRAVGGSCDTDGASRTSVARSRLADRAVVLVPVSAALALGAFVFASADPGVELVLLSMAGLVLAGGHLLLRGRTRRITAERETSRVRQEVDLRARVADCELRRLRLAAFSRLAAQIAHEVRNPLASIVLNTELLEEEIEGTASSNAEMRGLVQSIKAEAERLHALTDEYLAFARLPEPERVVQPLNPIVAELVQFVGTEASRRHVALAQRLSGDAPRVLVDARQVRQLVLNLVRNGIEAMPSGGRLDIATSVVGASAVIEVRDTGPGIPPQHRDAVFEPFFSTKPHGTGLGLALVRRIVLEHGGTVDVISDGGARFRVTLPLAPVGGASTSGPEARDAAADRAATGGGA